MSSKLLALLKREGYMPLCIQGSRAAGIHDRGHGLHIGLEAVILHHDVKNMLQLRARLGGCGRCGALLCRRLLWRGGTYRRGCTLVRCWCVPAAREDDE